MRRFLKDPGEVQEQVREQMVGNDARGPRTRCDKLAKHLAARQAEKDSYVRLYAQGHVAADKPDVPWPTSRTKPTIFGYC